MTGSFLPARLPTLGADLTARVEFEQASFPDLPVPLLLLSTLQFIDLSIRTQGIFRESVRVIILPV